jgi:hypothetical protein
MLKVAAMFHELGFSIMATAAQRNSWATGASQPGVNKVSAGRPHVVDAIKNREIQLVFNTVRVSKPSRMALPSAAPPSSSVSPMPPLWPVPGPGPVIASLRKKAWM